MKIVPRILIVILGCILLGYFVLRNEIQPSISHRMPLEVSWVSALAATLRHDLVSGRDYYYTYGLLSQIIAYLAFSLSNKGNEVLSYSDIINAFRILNILLFGIISLFFNKNTFYTILIFIYISFINLFTFDTPLSLSFSFRGLLLLLHAFVISKIFSSNGNTLRRLGSSLFGISSLISQLLTAELGVYSVLLFILSSMVVLLSGLNFINFKRMIESNLIMIGSYFASNICISFIFSLTARYSINLFDYQLYTLELIRGYANTMGVPWAADSRMTVVLILLIISTIFFTIVISNNTKTQERNMIICSLIAAIIFIRQATLRSDIGHILSGFTPLIILFLLLINWLNKTYLKLIWFTNVFLLATAWPLTNLNFNLLSSSYKISAEEIISSELNFISQANQYLNKKYILNFPSENYIGIILQKELVTPVLLAHNAHTVLLQERYVKILKERQKELDVTYALDNIATGAIDRVQHISRVPIIFDYLWQNYKLKESVAINNGIYILQPLIKPSPAPLEYLLRFEVRQEGQQLVAYLKQAAHCPLVKIEMYVAYPIYAFLGRSNGIWAQFLNGSQLVHESGLVAIETNRTFYTYISLLDDKDFYSLFSEYSYLPKQWDRLILSYRDTGFLGVNPSDLRISELYCVNKR